jgi:hypothetical protein
MNPAKAITFSKTSIHGGIGYLLEERIPKVVIRSALPRR